MERTQAQPGVREYVRPVGPWYWFTRPAYLKFMLRELSSAFLAAYAILLIVMMQRAKDPTAFHLLFEKLKSPVSVGFHLLVLFFALFHSITFIQLTPRVIVVQRGETRLPDAAIQGAHYVAWALVSFGVILLALIYGK